MYERCEAVCGVGAILDGPPRPVGIDDGVCAADDVAAPHLVLALRVAGTRVLDVVRVFVLVPGGWRVRHYDAHGGHWEKE